MKHLFEYRIKPKGEEMYWSYFETDSSRKTKAGRKILDYFNEWRFKMAEKPALTHNDLESFELREVNRRTWLPEH